MINYLLRNEFGQETLSPKQGGQERNVAIERELEHDWRAESASRRGWNPWRQLREENLT
jgi:hypothetical protein